MICFSFIVVVPDTYCTEAGFKSLVNIWKLAHRYGHHALFLHCLARIKPHIAVDNVLFLYRWSVNCGLPLLRLAVAKVMATNGAEVCSMPQAITFARESTKRFHEVTIEIFEYLRRD